MLSPPEQVELTLVRDVRGRYVLKVIGEIDLATVSVLRHGIERLVRSGHRSLVIDLSGVEFMDCRGIAVLFDAVGWARAAGVGLAAVASPECERLAGLTGLRTELDFYDRIDDVPRP